MLERIKKDIQSYRLFNETDQLALAISGGKDSVAVAHLLDELGVPFQMVHVNFGLRGEDSDGDEDGDEEVDSKEVKLMKLEKEVDDFNPNIITGQEIEEEFEISKLNYTL